MKARDTRKTPPTSGTVRNSGRSVKESGDTTAVLRIAATVGILLCSRQSCLFPEHQREITNNQGRQARSIAVDCSWNSKIYSEHAPRTMRDISMESRDNQGEGMAPS